MFVTKKYLSRRAALRGLGAAIGLPLLDSMLPAQTPVRKTAAASRTRFAAIEMVHGAAGSTIDGGAKHYWSPEKTGADFEFTQSLSPLEPFREYVTVISDTDLNNATALSPSEDPQPVAVRGPRCFVLGLAGGGQSLPRPGRALAGRRKRGRTGSGVPRQPRAPRADAGARRQPCEHDVALSHGADRCFSQHRGDLRDRDRRTPGHR